MRKPDSDMYQILRGIAPVLLGAELIFAVIVSYIFARRMTKSVLTVAKQARQMIDMDPGAVEYKVHSSDEVEILQEDLIRLYENLQETVQELQTSNQQLGEQIQVVQGMEKQKADFFAAASHELKTPIAAASVMLEGMIDQTGCYQDRERYLRECRKQMSRLSKLVQDILDITKLETFNVQNEPIDLKACLDKLIDEYDVLAERQMVRIKRCYSSTLQIESDPMLLKRAISNLLSNAVKYTPMEGNIVVRAYTEESQIIISITNEADPIDDKVLANYKNAFARPEAESSGSGLGLYIVHQICQILGYEFEIMNVKEGVQARILIPVK